MAIILSIESSASVSSIALHKSGQLISSQSIHIDKSHSEYLVPSIKNLCETSGILMKEIKAVAVSKGPGSYTGLRIGTSTAKGLCYGLDTRLVGINTLKAMGRGIKKYFSEDILLCPMLDARRMEVYCILLKNDGSVVEETQAKIIDHSSFQKQLADSKIVFFGSGSAKCKSILENNENSIFIDGIEPSAIQVGELAWEKYQNNQFEDLAYFEPYYLKDFIAKKPSASKLV
jgi:tRNA threonylcarbamoyladenosine biosynthesis protein TsaB